MSRRVVAVVVLAVVGLAFALGHLTAGGTDAPAASRPAGAAPGPIAVGFAQDMAVHHDQAVLMSNLAQTRAGPAVRAIADSILIGQSQQIGVLRGWLQLWHESPASPHPMAWMSGRHSSMPGNAGAAGAMPGMASPDELNALANRTGGKFDVMYLRLMIRHHQGGIAMARDAATHAKLGAVRQTAKAMYLQQIQDIAQMRALLAADGGKPLPPPPSG